MIKKHLLVLGLTGLAVVSAAANATEHGQTYGEESSVAEETTSTTSEASTTSEEGFLDDRWYVAPFGTFVQPGGDRDLKSGWGAGMGIGKIIDEYFNVEVRGFWQGFNNNQGGRADFTGGTVDVQYHFLGADESQSYHFRPAFSPYAVLGLGGMNTSANGDSGASFLGELGLGATYELADNFLLRSDVRYRYNYQGNGGPFPRDGDFSDLVVNAGFVVPFGDKPQPAAPIAAAPVDECSTRDTDQDGVNDCDDRCPGTMKGTKVDDQGCPIKIELKGVNFKYDSAELTPTAKKILDGVATQLIAFPEKKDIDVKGYCSSEGSDAYNLKLSQRRSQSVADYLKWAGVKNRLIPHGYGEQYPIANNDTEAGREKNRRVELVWVGD